MVYRTLERNTGAVGKASVLCTSVKAVNPEIAALQQHQDPASPGAAATNKQIALELAKQIASIGGDPNTAIQSGTFAPGSTSDTTGKGKSCDVQNDPTGCIFTQNLLVPDVTEAEIQAAVGSTGAAASSTVAAAAAVQTTAATTSDCGASTNNAVDTATSASAKAVTKSSLDLGTCSNASPDIKFGAGFDGRNTNSFEPVDKATFNHGSALGIAVVADFICGQLQSACKAPQATVTKCQAAAKAASALTGQAAANAFNSGLA